MSPIPPQSHDWFPSLSAVNVGPGLGQERSWLLPFPGGIKAEPEALWLGTKIGLNEVDGVGDRPPRAGNLEALGRVWERA